MTELDGKDELNRLFRYTVRFILVDPTDIQELAHELLQRPATLVFEESGTEVATVHGIAAELQYTEDTERDVAIASVTLVPRAWLLTQTYRSAIFLDRSVPQILTERLSGAGLVESEDFLLTLRGLYPVREHITQYGETDFNFFSRLCEDQGITFFFRHQEGRDVLVLTDVGTRSTPSRAFAPSSMSAGAERIVRRSRSRRPSGACPSARWCTTTTTARRGSTSWPRSPQGRTPLRAPGSSTACTRRPRTRRRTSPACARRRSARHTT